MGRMVLLRHDQGGDAHFDLLLERDSSDERRAVALRLDEAVDPTLVAEFQGERMPDHRAAYFEYEGQLPAPGDDGGRGRVSPNVQGRVERVFAGRCEFHHLAPDSLDVSFDLDGRYARLFTLQARGYR